MKKVLIVPILLMCASFFFIGCKKAQKEVLKDSNTAVSKAKESSSINLLIQPGIGVGKIKFGMTIKQMKDLLGKPDVEATGISYLYSSLGIEIIAMDHVNIDKIVCGNPENKSDPQIKALEQTCKFTTTEGIGIGSTEAQIIQAFGQPTSRRDNRLLYKDKHIYFSLNNGKVIGIWLQK